MLATYGSFLVVFAASCLVGQGVFALCGRRQWSWLAPAVGLSVLTAVAWGTVRLPGEGAASLIAIGALTLACLVFLIGRVDDLGDSVRVGLSVAVVALLAASLPFLVEGRFGILGTGLNPDMSQHLFAADQLAHGEGGRLLSQGYPLGPHSLVVAVSKGTGGSLVHCFDGLMLAISVAATLAPLALVGALAEWRRIVCALLVGLPYMAASYLIQGAFKETMEALFVLAFAIGLHELARGRLTVGTDRPDGARQALAATPLAALAVGAIYSYSFPGLLWLAGAAGLWAVVELGLAAARGSAADAMALARQAAPATAVALAAVAIAAAPEIGRMIDFASFETFDPSGPGLGNLFNRISPLEALGIWPSGDFRLDPGDGAAPALAYYLGGVLGLAALAYGLIWWLDRGERAVPSALAVAAALIAYAHFSGTPYQEAKSIMLASPLAMLISARALLSGEPAIQLGGLRGAVARRRGGVPGCLGAPRFPPPEGLGDCVLRRGRRLHPDRARQRAGWPRDVLAGPRQVAPPARCRFDPRPRPGAPARQRAWTRLPRLGAAGRAGVRRSRRSPLGRPAATGDLAGDRPEPLDAGAVREAGPCPPGRAIHAVAPPSPAAGPGLLPLDLRRSAS